MSEITHFRKKISSLNLNFNGEQIKSIGLFSILLE